jgi:hypothetical protein
MKVAIGFFGITRSLKYTIASIKENILDVLKLNNIDYDIFVHTFFLTKYKNIRTVENIKDTDIDNEEYKLLNANYIQIDDQERIKEQINISLYRTHPDPWNTNYNSVDNFILGQYSKLMLTNLIEKQQFNYDYILFMRPDCLYTQKFQIDFLNHINNNTIVIPDFHLFSKYKFNDRFSITNTNTYKIYGEIFINLLEISKKSSLHSETIIGQIMNNHGIITVRIPFRFLRVRYNGIIAPADKPLVSSSVLSKYCKDGVVLNYNKY